MVEQIVQVGESLIALGWTTIKLVLVGGGLFAAVFVLYAVLRAIAVTLLREGWRRRGDRG